MSALRQTGVTVLFIEHDMHIERRYAKRVVAFMEGTVIADGEPEAVLTHARVLATIVGEGQLAGATQAHA